MDRLKLAYTENLKKNLWNFILSRLFPFFGISIAAALLAHKNILDLPAFAYVLAVFSVISTTFSMPLAAIGNIIHNKKESLLPQQIFEEGLTVAALFSLLSLFVAALAMITIIQTTSLNTANNKSFLYLSIIYIPAIPLLVFNTFTHIFHEASDNAARCATIKKWCTSAGCGLLAIFFLLADKTSFCYFAIAYFPAVELATFVCLTRLSVRSGYRHVIKNPKNMLPSIVSLGFPIAAGMAGQKVYYYLLNSKLLSLSEKLAGDLSICMSVIGFLSIPLIGFSQLHSVYTSKNAADAETIYRRGLISCVVLLLAIGVIFSILGKLLFFIFGDDSLSFTMEGFISISVSIFCSGYFMLTTSHLRAMKDTLVPQLTINLIMLAVLIPVIYMSGITGESIYTYILLQSAAIFVAALLLQYRIYHLHKRSVIEATTVSS